MRVICVRSSPRGESHRAATSSASVSALYFSAQVPFPEFPPAVTHRVSVTSFQWAPLISQRRSGSRLDSTWEGLLLASLADSPGQLPADTPPISTINVSAKTHPCFKNGSWSFISRRRQEKSGVLFEKRFTSWQS